jgi:hypothetical protein
MSKPIGNAIRDKARGDWLLLVKYGEEEIRLVTLVSVPKGATIVQVKLAHGEVIWASAKTELYDATLEQARSLSREA